MCDYIRLLVDAIPHDFFFCLAAESLVIPQKSCLYINYSSGCGFGFTFKHNFTFSRVVVIVEEWI